MTLNIFNLPDDDLLEIYNSLLDAEMTHTSINHCKNSNYQIDYGGTRYNAIASFEDWCLKNEVIWAHLFDERTGEQVATFNGTKGLTTLAV